jgi:hypothetical protein
MLDIAHVMSRMGMQREAQCHVPTNVTGLSQGV